MQLKAIIVAAALGAASFGASATVYNLGTLNPGGFDTKSLVSESFGANAAINDTWTFTLLAPSKASFSALQTFADTAGAISSFAITFNGGTFTASPGTFNQDLVWGGPLAAGVYSFNVTGTTGLAGAQYLATASALTSPVPEPETYGMMLGGLALLGAVARRKARK